ncbi:hypothetical protein H0A65_04630 [Alcaligenaceae bacterium]|nr:hypothetical protein [Alcaligenaceae bacterium]
MKWLWRVFVFMAVALTSLQALAYTVDTNKYFAYVEKRGRYTQGVTIPSSLFLLSKRGCTAAGAPNSAKVGAIVYLTMQPRETPACWYIEKHDGNDIVVLCTTIGNKMDGGSAACEFISPARFLDVNSLPRAAPF